jgi:hypothetical protein
MSGGSYNYLCFKDGHQYLDIPGDLEDMAARLAKLGWAEDAAAETEELLLILRQCEVRAQARIDRLRDIWHAVEWWDSQDSGPEEVRAALDAYRRDKPA